MIGFIIGMNHMVINVNHLQVMYVRHNLRLEKEGTVFGGGDALD